MNNTRFPRIFLAAVLTLALAGSAAAQFSGISLPPGGANQKAEVSQWIGPVKVTITYNSPDVTSPTGEDRTGNIWGGLVPYGMASFGFGTCGDQCPWRGGANENTVFTVSDDVKIEGESLAAGSYGLHLIPGEEEWTIIFSNNSTSWGSFFYTAEEDALRVTVEPRENAYTHWLTYEFIDRQLTQATASLQWEHLLVPFTITVDNVHEIYLATIRNELRTTGGFSYLGYQAAANFCLQNEINLEEGLQWAENAISGPFIGQANFATLQTKALLQFKLSKTEDAEATLAQAVEAPGANIFQIHGLGRQLIGLDFKDKAMDVFRMNAEKYPDTWPVNFGLARGYSALGQFDEALKHAKLALGNAPDPANKQNVSDSIARLEKGEDIN
ncbi:MAG: DUF2911 domain-containing protein [bacterium]|nr:DUF2911 domain-containing protein [bacterium]